MVEMTVPAPRLSYMGLEGPRAVIKAGVIMAGMRPSFGSGEKQANNRRHFSRRASLDEHVCKKSVIENLDFITLSVFYEKFSLIYRWV